MVSESRFEAIEVPGDSSVCRQATCGPNHELEKELKASLKTGFLETGTWD